MHANMAKWVFHMLVFSLSDMMSMTNASPACDANVKNCLKSYSSMIASILFQSTATLHLNMYGNLTMDFLNPVHVWRRLCTSPDLDKTMTCAVNGLKVCDAITIKNFAIHPDHIILLETLSVNATATVTDTLKCNQYNSLEKEIACADHVITPGQLFHCPNLNQVRLNLECNPEVHIWTCCISMLDQMCPNLVHIYIHILQLMSHPNCKFDSCLIRHQKCEERDRIDQPVFEIPDAHYDLLLTVQKLIYLCGSGHRVVQCMSEGIRGCPIYQKFNSHHKGLDFLRNDVLVDLLGVGCDSIITLKAKIECLNATLNEDFINCYKTSIGRYTDSESMETACSVNSVVSMCTSNTVGVKCGRDVSDFLNKWRRVFFTSDKDCILSLRGGAFVSLPICIQLIVLVITSLALLPGNGILSLEHML